MPLNGLNNRRPFTIIPLENPMPQSSSDPLLTLRAAVILLLALVAGGSAGVLAYLAHHSVPAAALVAGGTVGTATLLFHSLIGR
jgi:hypothetical protein